ncbi:MAG: glycine--tRNA ligase [Candidatus Thermoplasmatota archaeon]|nr:glycine--tRNA ligase [Candidatus Thermoplasmatota archaeon]
MDKYSGIISLSKRRGIFYPSYDIYGGEAGFYDYGPIGTLLKNNVENKWRELYMLKENFFEISTPIITPYNVLKASGHVDKFLDVILTCENCGESFKAGDVPEENYEKLKCPECNGKLKKDKINLMFETGIGPRKKERAFLCPETAQGIFVNFPFLYQFSRKKLPLGVVQIGKGFRNEVSPRQGIIRLREFSMAEAEIFFDPENKNHMGFDEIKNDVITIIPAGRDEMRNSVKKIVEKGIIGNNALAYHIALTKRFLVSVGIDEKKLRFRQHLQKEMAHYASDCWDAEILTSFGWVECVGIADRTAYDIKAHMDATGVDMTAFKVYDKPVKEKRKIIVPKMDKLGPAFMGNAKKIKEMLEKMEPTDEPVHLKIDGNDIEIGKEFYDVVEKEITVTGKNFIPHVIEPSYGIDRVIYCILEHNYVETEKEGEKYFTLKLPSCIAPVKAGVFPLANKDGLPSIAREIETDLREKGIVAFYDGRGSIGRRYARMDEIGTPFCITVDYTTIEDNTVTVRWRDTTEQIRIDRKELAGWIQENM